MAKTRLVVTLREMQLDHERMGIARVRLGNVVEARGATELHINLKKVEFLSSGAIHELLKLQADVAKLGGKLVLHNLSKSIREIFGIVKLERVFNISTADPGPDTDDDDDGLGVGAKIKPRKPFGSEAADPPLD